MWFKKLSKLYDDLDIILSKNYLVWLFKFFWFDVCDNELEVYKYELEALEEEFKTKSNIYKIEWKYSFIFAKWQLSWPEINWWKLRNYPRVSFNKKLALSNDSWLILTIDDIKELFDFVWIGVHRDEKIIIRHELELNEEHLKSKANIFKVNWLWDFWNASWVCTWPKIQWKHLKYFPNAKFNRINGFWNLKWVISSIEWLKKLFKFVWMDVID